MSSMIQATGPIRHDPWYKYGVAFLFVEMALAIAVSAYSFAMTFGVIGSGH